MVIAVGTAFKAALVLESGSKPVYLIKINPSTGARYLAMWPYDVTFDGDTYTGLGPVAAIDTAEWADTPLTEQFLTFFVQNDPTLLADLQQNSRRRKCHIRLVFVDNDNAAIDDESLHLTYRNMVPGPLTGGRGQYVCQIGLESLFHVHRNAAVRTYSESEQLRRDATDHCMSDAGKNIDLTRAHYVQKSGLG